MISQQGLKQLMKGVLPCLLAMGTRISKWFATQMAHTALHWEQPLHEYWATQACGKTTSTQLFSPSLMQQREYTELELPSRDLMHRALMSFPGDASRNEIKYFRAPVLLGTYSPEVNATHTDLYGQRFCNSVKRDYCERVLCTTSTVISCIHP